MWRRLFSSEHTSCQLKVIYSWLFQLKKAKYPLIYDVESIRWQTRGSTCANVLKHSSANWGYTKFSTWDCFVCRRCSLNSQRNVASACAGAGLHSVSFLVWTISVLSFIGKIKLPQVNYLRAADKEMRWKYPMSLKALPGTQLEWVALVGSGGFNVVVFNVAWGLHRKIIYVKNLHFTNIMAMISIWDFPTRPTINIEDPTTNFWLGKNIKYLHSFQFCLLYNKS